MNPSERTSYVFINRSLHLPFGSKGLHAQSSSSLLIIHVTLEQIKLCPAKLFKLLRKINDMLLHILEHFN